MARRILILIFLICSALPVGWMVWQVLSHREVWSEARLDAFRLRLIARTVLFNGLAAMIATLAAIPVAIVLGRGRGWISSLVLWLLPAGLLIPSIAYTYGWKQAFRLANLDFEPAGWADTLRCIWTLAMWLWPVPAGIMGLALRQLDANVQQTAQLDGAYWRVTGRMMLSPIIAGLSCAALLAMQEFAIYEPTGISVVATEVRMVFDTGAFSSSDNPITKPLRGPEIEPIIASQGSRAAAAIVTGVPLLLIVGFLAVLTYWSGRRFANDSAVDVGQWPASLNAPNWAKGCSILLLVFSLGVPIAALLASMSRPWNLKLIWGEFGPELAGSTTLASISGLLAIGLILLAILGRARRVIGLALLGFLVGGQFLAIAQIHLYNRPSFMWVYDSAIIVLLTYIARFGWIALLAGRSTWSPAWRELRDMAAIDGASERQSAWRVVVPIALPMIIGAGLLVAVLSLGEVPATVLIQPLRPPMLVSLMMTWVHNLRYDPMIEASMLLVGGVMILAILIVGLSRMMRGRVKEAE